MKHIKQPLYSKFCSRRAFRYISSRQRQRIAAELRCSRVEASNHLLHNHYNKIPERRDSVEHLISINNSMAGEQSDDSKLISQSNVVDLEIQNVLSESEQSFSDTNTTYYSDNNGNNEDGDNIDYTSFTEKLATCFIECGINHVQGNMILNILHSHNCLSYLPKDVRTLLKTPRVSVELRNVPPGEYLHTGFVAGITNSLLNVPQAVIPQSLEIDFSTDGATLDKSGQIQIWPIQCRIANISDSKPEIVGIYRGKRKPLSAVEFFQDFVDEVNLVMKNGGIMFEGSRLSVVFKCFIADAPARAFVLNHKGHTSFHPCSKCKVSGEFYERRPVFLGIDHIARTDVEYAERRDEDHHKQGNTPLSHIPIGMVSQIPFESMHLIYLGIGKKLFSAWVSGQYSISSRLPSFKIAEISARLIHLVKYYPRDFNRPPRPIEEYSNYKATEIRHFILYTGPVVLNGILSDELYKHFLLLHTALRCLSYTSPPEEYLIFAELALRLYVKKCSTYYGISFMSYNVHGLLHIVDDVKTLGPLDTYSAFAYENNMRIFKRYSRKPHLPLQQIARRRAEESNYHDRHLNRKSLRDHQTSKLITVRKKHNAGPIPKELSDAQQYSELQTDKFTLGLQFHNHCCLLQDKSICIIVNVLIFQKMHYLNVKKFRCIENFYDVGISSISVGVFKCSNLGIETFVVPVSTVEAKCYQMPYWQSSSADEDCSSSDETSNAQKN